MSLEQQQEMYQSLIQQNKQKLQLEKDEHIINILNNQIKNAKQAIDYIAKKTSYQ